MHLYPRVARVRCVSTCTAGVLAWGASDRMDYPPTTQASARLGHARNRRPELGASAEGAAATGSRLGFAPGQVVQELGYDDDVDFDLRDGIEDVTGGEMVDEDYDETVDAVLLWWRDDDGDLVDALVDSLTSLADGGVIWLLTPKAGRPGHVEPSDIGEAAPTAGLSQTSSISAAPDWSGTRLVAPKAARSKR